MSDDGILNQEGLRFNNEFVRHKILDAIGDIFIVGKPIIAHIEAYCAGHRLMHEVLKALEDDKGLWSLISSSKLLVSESSYNNQEIQSYI